MNNNTALVSFCGLMVVLFLGLSVLDYMDNQPKPTERVSVATCINWMFIQSRELHQPMPADPQAVCKELVANASN